MEGGNDVAISSKIAYTAWIAAIDVYSKRQLFSVLNHYFCVQEIGSPEGEQEPS